MWKVQNLCLVHWKKVSNVETNARCAAGERPGRDVLLRPWQTSSPCMVSSRTGNRGMKCALAPDTDERNDGNYNCIQTSATKNNAISSLSTCAIFDTSPASGHHRADNMQRDWKPPSSARGVHARVLFITPGVPFAVFSSGSLGIFKL